MSQLIAGCPRCGSAKMTFDVRSAHRYASSYGWQHEYEAFCICRYCGRATVFLLALADSSVPGQIGDGGLADLPGYINKFVNVRSFVSVKNMATSKPPNHLPKNIEDAFREGATCLAVECFNAAGAMFRLCIDLATRPLLPEEGEGLTSKVRRDLGLRLPWLFNHSILPNELRELSSCVKEDGNAGAHAGTLTKTDADDLHDFAYAFLERLYTKPKGIELAKARREARRRPK